VVQVELRAVHRSVVCSAWRDSWLSFANASSAGSANECAASTPEKTVKPANVPRADRVTTRAHGYIETSLKICILKRPSTSSAVELV